MRSPASRVGHIDAEGMDLGSANEDLKSILTVKAVKTAFASSDLTFKNLETQHLSHATSSKQSLSTSSLNLVPLLSTSILGIMEDDLKGEIPKIPMEEEAPETTAEHFMREIKPMMIGEGLELSPTNSPERVEKADLGLSGRRRENPRAIPRSRSDFCEEEKSR